MGKICQSHIQLILLLALLYNANLIESISWTKKIVCSAHALSDNVYHDDPSTEKSFQDTSHVSTDFEMNLNSTPISTIFNTKARKEQENRFPLSVSFKMNLKGAMSSDESLYLLYLNMANKLQYGRNQLSVNPVIEWKRNVMNKIKKIFLQGCPSTFVPKGYINMITELFMHYQTQLSLTSGNANKEEQKNLQSLEKWNVITSQVLQDCEWSSLKLNLTGTDKRIKALRIASPDNDDGSLVEIKIHPAEEYADSNEPPFNQMDEIIDDAWWIFSFVHGRCFHHFRNSSLKSKGHGNANDEGVQDSLGIPTAEEFRELFEKDFLTDLMARWLDAGRYARSFGTIFGYRENALVKRNLRYCVTAAYMENSVEDNQLLRPLEFRYKNLRMGTYLF